MTTSLSPAQRLLQLMEHNLDFVEILGANGVVQGVSAAIKPLGGYDPRDLVGRQYQDIVHPEDRARAEEAFARALHGTLPETVKLRYRAKGGSWRTILASTQSFLRDPAVHAVVVLTRDVTEQCDVEASLVLANSRVADLTEQLIGAAEGEGLAAGLAVEMISFKILGVHGISDHSENTGRESLNPYKAA